MNFTKPNEFKIENETVIIYMETAKYGRKECFVSLKDWPRVRMLKWYLTSISKSNKVHYAFALIGNRRIFMHRLISSFPVGQIDHLNRNGLDNRDENLITVTARENSQNKPVYANNRLGVKGVRKHAYKNGTVKYGARIRIDGKLTYLGQYGTLEEAKYWRDEAEFIFFHTSLSQRETVSAPRRP